MVNNGQQLVFLDGMFKLEILESAYIIGGFLLRELQMWFKIPYVVTYTILYYCYNCY